MFLYLCKCCFRPGSGAKSPEGLFFAQSDKGQVTKCPTCGKDTAQFQRAYKRRVGQIKGAVGFESAIKKSERRGRPGRGQITRYGEGEGLGKLEIGVTPVEEEEQGDEDDAEYVPQIDFSPAMRFHPSGDDTPRATCRSLLTVTRVVAFDIVTKQHQITLAAGRLDTGTVMGSFLCKGKPKRLAAQTWAARGTPYRTCKYTSLEWCHLFADSLGGPTVGDNLVAASYAANTFMLAIESCLQAKTTLKIQLGVVCSKENVAELIDYKVIRPNGVEKIWTIDARNDHFTRGDYAKIKAEVEAFLA